MLKIRVLVLLLGWLVFPALPQQLSWEQLAAVKPRTGEKADSLAVANDGTVFTTWIGNGGASGIFADTYKRTAGDSGWISVSQKTFAFSNMSDRESDADSFIGGAYPFQGSLYRSWMNRILTNGTLGRGLNKVDVAYYSRPTLESAACSDLRPVAVTGKDSVAEFRGPFPTRKGVLFTAIRKTATTVSTSGLYRLTGISDEAGCTLSEIALFPQTTQTTPLVWALGDQYLALRKDKGGLVREIILFSVNEPKGEVTSSVVLITNRTDLAQQDPPPLVAYNELPLTLVADPTNEQFVVGYTNQKKEQTFLLLNKDTVGRDVVSGKWRQPKFLSPLEAFEPVRSAFPVHIRDNQVLWLGYGASNAAVDTLAVTNTLTGSTVRVLQAGKSVLGTTQVTTGILQPQNVAISNDSVFAIIPGTGTVFSAKMSWPEPLAYINATPTEVVSGQQYSVLDWRGYNGNSFTLNGETVQAEGLRAVKIDKDTTFTFVVKDPYNRSASASVTVTVKGTVTPVPEPEPPKPEPPKPPQIAAVVSAELVSPILPGSTIVAYGANLASKAWEPGTDQVCDINIVTPDGSKLSILYASPTQVNIQLPADLGEGDLWMQATNANGASDWVKIVVAPKPETPVPPEVPPTSPTEPNPPPAPPPTDPEEP